MAGSTDAQALLLTVSADTSKALKAIDKLNSRLAGVAPEMQRSAHKAAQAVEKEFEGIDVSKAVRKVFDSSKLAVVEEGSAKLRVFGSAIEPLGPLGIAAAAGVAALSAALEEAHKAVEYADGLYKAAAAAHVSTDALQEFRQGVEKAGGDTQAAGPALLAFSETLGKASEGLKGLRPFKALFGTGFGVSDVKALGDTEHALDAVVAKIQNLRSRSQQDAAIGQFGLQGLAPLILAGADAWKEWREEAHKSGEILDADVIRRGHEMATQIDELTTKIKNDLTTAFINLGPVLVNLLGYVSKLLDGVKAFTAEIHKYPALGKLVGDVAAAPFRSALGQDGIAPIARDAVEFGREKTTEAQFDVSKGLSEGELQAALGAPKPSGTGELADLTKTPKIQNEFAQKAAEAQAEQDKQNRELQQANAALTDNVEAHAEFEKQAAGFARDQIFDQINKAEAAAIQAANEKKLTDSQRDQLLSQYELAKEVADQVLSAKDNLTDRKALNDTEKEALEASKATRDAEIARLRLVEGTAVTEAERNAAARQRLRIEQNQDFQTFAQGLSDQVRSGKLTQDEADRRTNLFVSDQAASRAQQVYDQAGPIEKYARSIQDLNTAVQNDAVTAFQDLTSGLIDAALHAKNLGDVAKNVFLNLIQQILTQTLQKEALPGLEAAGSALLHLIPGFASGTSSAPGGLAIVGERGPELVNLPRGSQVLPHFQTLDAVSRMAAPQAAAVTVVQPFHFHAEGAVVTQDLLDQANASAARMAAQAGAAARRGAVGDVQRGAYLGQINS